MKTFVFAILVALLVLSFQAEARRSCPNVCTSRKRARRQCRRRRVICKVARCGRRKGRKGRRKGACVPRSGSPPPSPSVDPSATPTSTATASPSMTPSTSSTPSATPSITPSPSPTPIVNRLADVAGVSCPSGTSPGPFGGDNCDLTSLRVVLAVGPSNRFGFPPRANCPGSPVAGGGRAGCTFCGDDTSNSVRELFIDVFHGNAGCIGVDVSVRIGESIEATATADGVQLCPREFDIDDGGSYITQTLSSKFQNVVNDAFCV